ncbi:MAG: tRNA uridine-5-carboxymethylaminomethyl(34) synthesis GTPase MnmE [Desulfatitalea sp.]
MKMFSVKSISNNDSGLATGSANPKIMGQETIAAIATPAGRGGIGIVRISGSHALAAVTAIFRIGPAGAMMQKESAANALKPHHLHYGHIIDPLNGQTVDEVLLAVMPGPHSYTREDVVEIQSHGGTIIVEKILRFILQRGVRLAEPGEFTRRAFLNGRIDLTQAEAVADLINARSESAISIAAQQLGGGLKNSIQAIVQQMNELLADIEAGIEFGEDVSSDAPEAIQLRTALINNIIAPIERLINSYQSGQLMREGIRLAIVGRPNVGKSSLLNRLIDREKAIVTPIPGTTRDPVEAITTIGGIAVNIIDTAGLHDSNDPVERIGIQKTNETIESADLTLFVIEANQTPAAADNQILRRIKERRLLLVVNKIDLIDASIDIDLPDAYRNLRSVRISALSGAGMAQLKEDIAGFFQNDQMSPKGSSVICDLRHKISLEKALEGARHALVGLDEGQPVDIVALDLQRAVTQIKKITGECAGPEVLDAIFKKFCIGK